MNNSTDALRSDRLPIVGITIGDVAGIGPEISLKAVADADVRATCRTILIGDLAYLKKAAADLGFSLDFVES